jgi:hypothetical protein
MHKIAHAHRGDPKWHFVGLPHQSRSQRRLCDIRHHSGLQHDIIELSDIARRADLAPSSPFDKIKDKPGQPPVSQPSRVFVRKNSATALRHTGECLGICLSCLSLKEFGYPDQSNNLSNPYVRAILFRIHTSNECVASLFRLVKNSD